MLTVLLSLPPILVAVQVNTLVISRSKSSVRRANTLPDGFTFVFDVHLIVGTGKPVETHLWLSEKDSNSIIEVILIYRSATTGCVISGDNASR